VAIVHAESASQSVAPSVTSVANSDGSPAISAKILAGLTNKWQNRLAIELEPRGILQELVVSVLARNAATMDFGAAAEAAALDVAAQNAAALRLLGGIAANESALVAAMSSDHVRRASRYRSQQERAFFAATKVWTCLASAKNQTAIVSLFASEDACIDYLADWQSDQQWICPSCGDNRRWPLRGRAKFQCSCSQFSIRHGTLFAGSRVPLLGWFDLITALVIDPSRKAKDLANQVRVVRLATLRPMIEKILTALSSPTADQELAGLPAYIAQRLLQVYAPRGAASLPGETPDGASVAANAPDFQEKNDACGPPRQPR
jgi:hypothetical protein